MNLAHNLNPGLELRLFEKVERIFQRIEKGLLEDHGFAGKRPLSHKLDEEWAIMGISVAVSPTPKALKRVCSPNPCTRPRTQHWPQTQHPIP